MSDALKQIEKQGSAILQALQALDKVEGPKLSLQEDESTILLVALGDLVDELAVLPKTGDMATAKNITKILEDIELEFDRLGIGELVFRGE